MYSIFGKKRINFFFLPQAEEKRPLDKLIGLFNNSPGFNQFTG